jgi:hypothetical protein
VQSGSKCCTPPVQKKVLIYEEFEQVCQSYAELKAHYNTIGTCEWYGCGAGADGLHLPSTFNINNYSLIYILMPLNVDSRLSAANVLTWLGGGQRRLVITGEFGTNFDLSSIFCNNYCSSLGITPTVNVGTLIDPSGGCASLTTSFTSYYLVNGLSSWVNAGTASVSAGGSGTLLNTGIAPTLAVQKIGTSEVIVSGDTNCFGGVCPLPSGNKPFISRLLQTPVQ